MSDPILPLAVWQSGTNQNSIPANDNSLRIEAITRPCLGVSNSPPTTEDGDVYLVGSSPSGAFSTFDEDDIAIYRSSNWYAWAPVDGLTLIVNEVRKIYAGDSTAAWIDDPSIAGGAGGTPGGPTTAIQYNNSGSFGGEANFAYDETTNTMTVGNINVQTGGLAYTPPSTTANAGLRVAPGAAPTSPVNGDVWTTSAGMFVRINGVTVGPLGATGSATWGAISGTLSSQTDLQSALDAKAAVGIPQNAQLADYTLVISDANKHVLHPSADTTARVITIPANASVPFPIGTAVTFVNQVSAGVMTIAITSDTMRLAGAGTTGSRTLAANGIATALKITSTEWIINGTGLT